MKKRGLFPQGGVAYLLAAPQILLALLTVYWPALQAASWSLALERPFGGSAGFAGLENFAALFGDGVFLRSLATTLVFTSASTAASLIVAIVLAAAAAAEPPILRKASAVMLWPYAVAAPAAGIVMSLVLDPRVGLAAFVNDWRPGAWAPSIRGGDAMILVVAAFVWLHAPLNFIFLLAGFKALPASVSEAAALDGAGPWRRLMTVRLPLLRPQIFFLLALDASESLTQSFGVIATATGGGPGGATNTVIYDAYANGFLALDFSRASAESVLLMAAMGGLAAVQFGWFERRSGDGR